MYYVFIFLKWCKGIANHTIYRFNEISSTPKKPTSAEFFIGPGFVQNLVRNMREARMQCAMSMFKLSRHLLGDKLPCHVKIPKPNGSRRKFVFSFFRVSLLSLSHVTLKKGHHCPGPDQGQWSEGEEKLWTVIEIVKISLLACWCVFCPFSKNSRPP